MLKGGYHLLIDLAGCNPAQINSPQEMRRLCQQVARLIGARVICDHAHKFSPQGVTAFALVAESHVSIHTWPESGLAFIDVFTCKEGLDVDKVLDFTVGTLGAKKGRTRLHVRNDPRKTTTIATADPGAVSLDFGRTILNIRSPFQRIELTKGPMGLSLFLDGYWQFVEQYEHVYHEVLVHPAMVCAPALQRVAIGGGGDGLAAREVCKYSELGRLWLFEIDPWVLDVARRHPEMVRLNRGSLSHSRVTVVAADARKIFDTNTPFDVLILDFPSVSDGEKFKPLYSESFYRRAKKSLAPGGILVTQVTDYPHRFRATIANLTKVFKTVLPIQVMMDASVFNFVLASEAKLAPRRRLPDELRYLTADRLSQLLSQPTLRTGRMNKKPRLHDEDSTIRAVGQFL